MIDTTIVIPCYNEADRLPYEAFSDFIRSHSGIRFLFVDDGSRDGTRDVLHALRAEHPMAVDVMGLATNRGKAEAVRLGFRRAIDTGTRYVGFWDADLATPLPMIPNLRRVFSDNPKLDMVFGSRVELLGHRIKRHWARFYLGRGFNTVVALLIGLRVHDTQCGAKLFRVTPDLKQIFAHQFRTKWVFDVEMIARLLHLRRGRRVAQPEDIIQELPLPMWEDVAGSKVRAKDFLTALVDLTKIYLHHIRPIQRRIRASRKHTRRLALQKTPATLKFPTPITQQPHTTIAQSSRRRKAA